MAKTHIEFCLRKYRKWVDLNVLCIYCVCVTYNAYINFTDHYLYALVCSGSKMQLSLIKKHFDIEYFETYKYKGV